MDARTVARRPAVDDIARGIVVLGVTWLWLLSGALALIPAAFGAAALALNKRWARWPLAVSALVVAGITSAIETAGNRAPEAVAVLIVPGVVVAVAAPFVRIGDHRGNPAHASVPEIAWDRAAPSRIERIDDDPVLLAYLDSIAHLDEQGTRRLAAAWRAIEPDARERAWRHVRGFVARSERRRVLEDVRSEIESWGRAAGGSPWTWSFGTMTDVDRGNLRRAAMPALLDAAAAVLARDALDPADRDALAGPWEAATTGSSSDESTAQVGGAR